MATSRKKSARKVIKRSSMKRRNPEYVREFWDEAKAMNILLSALVDEQYTLKSNREIILNIDGDNYLISVEKLPSRRHHY